MFTDHVSLFISAGKGGNGVVAWRREKYIPKGGPAGGDGGKGGDVTITATANLYSLEDFRNLRQFKAENGRSGGANCCKGRNGKDIQLKVPLGTLIKDAKTGEVLFDLTKDKETIYLCRGGKGGKGNTFFKSPTNQAPDEYTAGVAGEEKEVVFELKLIADVGLVGQPNAGKSTLIKALTYLPVKIAPYPFTTLKPNLALMEFEDYTRVLIADIPGIIENAHKNKGLGLSFLKHIERTSALIFVIDISGEEKEDPFQDFLLLQNELKNYDPSLLKKPFLVALNKSDVEGSSAYIEAFKKAYPYDPSNLIVLSGKEQTNIPALKAKIHQLFRKRS